MACRHKFYNDVNFEGLDYEPEVLIVGSFSPEWPENNTAEWLYGRTDDNFFWDVLPRLYGEPSLIDGEPEDWKQFCRDKKIVLTDLISVIDDAEPTNKAHRKMLGGFSDLAIMHNFDDFEFTNVVLLLQQNPGIKQVYLTRGITEAFWRHLWSPVMRYCNQNGLRERILLTPDKDAQYHYEAYNKEHPDAMAATLPDYILMRWREVWHF